MGVLSPTVCDDPDTFVSRLHPDFNETLKIDIPICMAGAFAFYTTYTSLPAFSASTETAAPIPTRTATYYIDVSPRLTLADSVLPLNSLSIFSVVSKFMGKWPADWEKHLKGISQREYNMVHFTPLMERGDSNSPYSIYDQLQFDPATFHGGEQDVARMIQKMETEYHLLGLTDVVWNHTANNSKWLEDHPEAGYNIKTAPWLEAALELDTALLDYGRRLPELGLPAEISSSSQLDIVIAGIKSHVIDPLKLWQYYTVDVKTIADDIVRLWTDSTGSSSHRECEDLAGVATWSLEQKAQYLRDHDFVGASELGPRFYRTVSQPVAASMLTALCGNFKSDRITAAMTTIMDILNEINVPFYKDYDSDVAVILQQVHDRTRYLRLDDDGPKQGPISATSPLIETYFSRLPTNSTTQRHDPRSLALVNNGWIWAADALKDHAGSDSRAYLRREVIVWSDCVKLRYGSSPADNPFLWDFMARYTRLMAKYFAGFRIDNCHSTPLVVAEYLLDQAREVRPNLAVFAELFTGSEEMDYVFVKRLGLSALIREAMQAWSTEEVSRLVHMHGGRPIGSFEIDEITSRHSGPSTNSMSNGTHSAHCFPQERVHRIRQSPVHALFMDCTHDNEVPTQKRDARDTLPNAALVSMCASATGSVMGYDEIYPRLVNIVHEKRIYGAKAYDNPIDIGGGNGGIGGIKKLLNRLHTMMGIEGFDETFIHLEGEYITIHRVHPLTRKGYFLIAHTAFPGYGAGHGVLTPIHLAGAKARLLRSRSLQVDLSELSLGEVLDDPVYLRGLQSRLFDVPGVQVDERPHESVLSVPPDFPPGSISLFETWMPSTEHIDGIDNFVTSAAQEAFADLDLIDLNFMLYRCEAEERDFSEGRDGVYSIPNHGPLVYAGLQGWWSILKDVIRSNDLGHAICVHLRDGQWALDYVVSRLERMAMRMKRPSLHKAAAWLSSRFEAIKIIPSFLLPRYFAMTIQTAYNASWNRAMDLFGGDIKHGQRFLQALAMTSIQMTGYVSSASLYPNESVPALSAGLTHFSTSWTRCWGRDIFIALRGLYLATGRYEDAKRHIKAFATVLKHGMIPNLLSDGTSPRYNSRDSIWFFLQNIQDYATMVPDGLDILGERVARRFLPYDDTYFEYDDPRAYSKDSTISEVIQESLQRHATGLSFVEANAGPQLDQQMKPEGFRIDIQVDWENGMIFGGNQYNCGTWMDKMGESTKAGSKGVPGTPRDGADIEIMGLAYSTLKWAAELHRTGQHQWSGVKTVAGEFVSFADWATLIRDNFERCFYIPISARDDTKYNIDPSIVNRRGIYKDIYRSGKPYEDYQLRANFSIAMTVAPDLFDPTHALHALEIADAVLLGPMGMATLDPSDLNYRPYYVNSEDSTDFATSKGRNYHQGPEWLWPTGYFLRAMLKFDLMRRTTAEGRIEAFQQITRRLAGCKRHIEESPWAGLPELTQKNGEYCGDSVSLVHVSYTKISNPPAYPRTYADIDIAVRNSSLVVRLSDRSILRCQRNGARTQVISSANVLFLDHIKIWQMNHFCFDHWWPLDDKTSSSSQIL